MKSVVIFAEIVIINLVAKQLTALFFSIVFLMVLITPTVLIIVDETFDTSIVVSISEEEQEKVGEKDLDIELLLSNYNLEAINCGTQILQINTTYCNRTYNTPHFNIISPPPEHPYL